MGKRCLVQGVNAQETEIANGTGIRLICTVVSGHPSWAEASADAEHGGRASLSYLMKNPQREFGGPRAAAPCGELSDCRLAFRDTTRGSTKNRRPSWVNDSAEHRRNAGLVLRTRLVSTASRRRGAAPWIHDLKILLH